MIVKGSRVVIKGCLCGTVTRVTRMGVVWVKVKSRWGHHHHPATCKTFKCAVAEVALLSK